MRVETLKKVLHVANVRGYFKRLDGTYTVVDVKRRGKERRWFSPESELAPENMGLDILLHENGAN